MCVINRERVLCVRPGALFRKVLAGRRVTNGERRVRAYEGVKIN